MQFSQIYDKSFVTDTIIEAVSMFRKSYCDRYLKLYLVIGTFCPDTGVGKIMGKGALPLYQEIREI